MNFIVKWQPSPSERIERGDSLVGSEDGATAECCPLLASPR